MAIKNREKTKTSKPGVFRLKGGGWLVQATQRSGDGRRVYRRQVLPAGLTLAEAARKRAELVLNLAEGIEHGVVEEVSAPRNTLSAYAEQWLARKSTRLKPSVEALYLAVIGRRVLPVLGEHRIDALTRSDLVGWVAWAEAQETRAGRPYAQDTLRQWWRVLRVLVKDAAAETGIPDPTYRVEQPRSSRTGVREKATLTGAQLRQLLAVVERAHPRWHAEAFLMAFSGVRPGELYALEWNDVDEASGVIHVCRSVWRGQAGKTKTDDPREIALTEPILRVLQGHRQRMIRDQHPGLEAGLVFPADTGGYRGSEALRGVLLDSARRAKIPFRVTPQVLRRTFNTLMLEAGVNEVILRAQMGHATEEMTSRYAGVHAEAKQEAVGRLHALVRPREEKE